MVCGRWCSQSGRVWMRGVNNMVNYPSRTEFCQLASCHNIVPVYTSLSTDMDTPVSLYYKFVGDGEGFMLESAESNKTFGRYSFIGASSFAKVVAYAKHTDITIAGQTKRIEGKPVPILKDFFGKFSFPNLPGLPPFTGGAVGYFAYEAITTWERVLGQTVADDLVLGEFMFCDTLVVMDHLTHSTMLLKLVRIEAGADVAAEYDKAVLEIEAMLERIRQPVSLPVESGDLYQQPPASKALWTEDMKQRFCEKVAVAKEHIVAGDIFQVVISQPFRQKLPKHPFALYRRLRQVSPSPYMFYLNFGVRKIVGASPEMLVKQKDDRIFTCPIAGTRPRGKDTEEDLFYANDLLADTKELAEHAMLVDLARNDLGRISIPGTVTVDKMMKVELFSHVMHIVSEVSGQIDPKYSAFDVLTACFPAGTVSGAPKVRAMEIIYELEQNVRGAYAGALGYFDFRGNMDTAITIRTMAVDGDELTIRTGAGIVADSVPETEFQEVLNKAKALFQIVGEEV